MTYENKIHQKFSQHEIYPGLVVRAKMLRQLRVMAFIATQNQEQEAKMEDFIDDAWREGYITFALGYQISLNGNN